MKQERYMLNRQDYAHINPNSHFLYEFLKRIIVIHILHR